MGRRNNGQSPKKFARSLRGKRHNSWSRLLSSPAWTTAMFFWPGYLPLPSDPYSQSERCSPSGSKPRLVPSTPPPSQVASPLRRYVGSEVAHPGRDSSHPWRHDGGTSSPLLLERPNHCPSFAETKDTSLQLHSNSDKGDGSVRYILSGEGAGSIFVIDETTGDIHAAKSLDRERKTQYVLHARAVDRQTNRSLEAESEFIIKVQDVNDNAPTFPDGPFSATVPEMADVGTSVFQVTASDADDPTYGNSAKIVYSILEGQPYFSVDPKTGIIRTALSNMDRESRDRYAVVIQAKDMAGSVGGLSGSTTINITLTDVNDNPPKFPQKSYQLYVPESAPVGKAVGRIRANDEDERENAEMSYAITNADAAAIFTITTDTDRREGIISLKQ
ncbi:cadherin-18-like, partial [Centroberyx affinis]|uniref:cadherin-18-like n=1 Tax=Centroberyx affinis TaxID=166261 RepID=UPI003A5BB3D8